MIVIVKFDTNKKYLDQFSGTFRRLYHLHSIRDIHLHIKTVDFERVKSTPITKTFLRQLPQCLLEEELFWLPKRLN